MADTMYCPFLKVDYKDKKGFLRVRCERAIIDFGTDAERKDYVCRYCGSLRGWRDCTVAQSIMKHYESEEEVEK